jgi:hypothetical protein
MEETLTVQTKVRRAQKADLLIGVKLLKFGQPYYVQSTKTNALTGVFMLDQFTNSQKLSELFDAKRIYVPVVEWDDNIHLELLQTDIKKLANHGHTLYKRQPKQPEAV